MLKEPRVAKGMYSSSAYLWKSEITDSRGERCGPLMTINGWRRKTVAERLREMDEDARWDGDAIVRAFDACVEKAKEWAAKKYEMEVAASKIRAHKRRQAVGMVVEKVAASLAHDLWASFAAVQHWDTYSGKTEQPLFHALVHDILYALVKAPSTASPKRIKQAVAEVERRLVLVRESGLVDAEFLVDSDDPFEKIMRSFYLLHWQGVQRLLSRLRGYAVQHLLENIESKKLLEALYSLVPPSEKVIVSHTVANIGVSGEERRGLATVLATTLWKERSYHLDGDSSDLCARYRSFSEYFKDLYQALSNFLAAPVTVENLEKPDEVNSNDAMLSMEVVRDEACGKSKFWQSLRSGEYDRLINSLAKQRGVRGLSE